MRYPEAADTDTEGAAWFDARDDAQAERDDVRNELWEAREW